MADTQRLRIRREAADHAAIWTAVASEIDSEDADAVRLVLDRPGDLATSHAERLGRTLDEVKKIYASIATSGAVGEYINSPYYSRRLLWNSAAALVNEFRDAPDRLNAILDRTPVLSRTVEIHATRGTCAYSCEMCLWSDKSELTYRSLGLDAGGALTQADWCGVLDELARHGVRTVVVSGGGEALLNPDLAGIMSHARSLGLKTQLYTTGFNLRPTDSVWEEVLRCSVVRFSIHSPRPDVYNGITGMPPRRRALDRVRANLVDLLAARDPGDAVIGAGFVTQQLNHRLIAEMATWAAEVGVDFLAIRKEEVDVSEALTPEEVDTVRDQIVEIRRAFLVGVYGRTSIDFGDDLIALANGERPVARSGAECFVKYVRPTVSPFGVLAACDLKAEPRFSHEGIVFGDIRGGEVSVGVRRLAEQRVDDNCAQCMPSSRATNVVFAKVINDLGVGVQPSEQPFCTPLAQ